VALQQLVNSASPDDAAKQAIKTQGSFDEFQPFQRDDSGANLMTFNPRTGEYTRGPAKSIDPNNALSAATQRRGQDIGVQTARLNQAAATERARISANVTMSEGEKNRALRALDIQVKQRMVELGMPQDTPLARGSSAGIVWDD
jgi:hypothetical protein